MLRGAGGSPRLLHENIYRITMAKFSLNQAVPFESTQVGEVIRDELEARDMKQSELSDITGIQRSILNNVIKGKRALTPEMAVLIEAALDIPAYVLMNIQSQDGLNKARASERVVLQLEKISLSTL